MSSRSITATRAIVALHALWIVLSRPCLPSLFAWPQDFWNGVPVARYGWWFGAAEWPLYVLLMIALPLAIWSRTASALASILLYHFAPLEDVFIASPGPYARGLTVDVLALAVLAFAPRRSDGARWPLMLVRFAVASPYTFSTIAKLRTSGFDWFSGGNIRGLAATFSMLHVAPHPEAVMHHPAFASLIGISWFVLSIAMMVAVASRRVAMLVVPLTAIAHIVAAAIFGIFWLAAPLLLVFVEWDHSATPNSSDQRASA